MLHEILSALLDVDDAANTFAGPKSKSRLLAALGCATWLALLAGIIWLFIR
jgi:hypothetical protein